MKRTISKEQMSLLPLKQFEGESIVVEDQDAIEELVKLLKKESVIGFDTETKPAFKKGVVYQVSLLQLSTIDKAYLFRLNKLGFHPSLIDLLEDSNVLKVGVGIRDDLRLLKRLKDFKPNGFVELQTVATDLGFEEISLKKLAALLMQIRISKRQRLSNWESEELSTGQVLYAATDAWAALEIYYKLQKCEKFPEIQNIEQ